MAHKLGRAIQQGRQARRLDQWELGQAIGVSPSSISNYESGKQNPRLPVYRRLLDVFEVPEADRPTWDAMWLEGEDARPREVGPGTPPPFRGPGPDPAAPMAMSLPELPAPPGGAPGGGLAGGGTGTGAFDRRADRDARLARLEAQVDRIEAQVAAIAAAIAANKGLPVCASPFRRARGLAPRRSGPRRVHSRAAWQRARGRR